MAFCYLATLYCAPLSGAPPSSEPGRHRCRPVPHRSHRLADACHLRVRRRHGLQRSHGLGSPRRPIVRLDVCLAIATPHPSRLLAPVRRTRRNLAAPVAPQRRRSAFVIRRLSPRRLASDLVGNPGEGILDVPETGRLALAARDPLRAAVRRHMVGRLAMGTIGHPGRGRYAGADLAATAVRFRRRQRAPDLGSDVDRANPLRSSRRAAHVPATRQPYIRRSRRRLPAAQRLSASSSTKPAESRPQPTRLAFAVLLLVAVTACLGSFRRLSAYESPYTLWRDTIFHQPNNFIANYNLASIYYAENEIASAIPYFEAQLNFGPTIGPQNSLSTSLLQLKRYRDAVPVLEKMLQLKPDDFPSYVKLADAYVQTNRPDEAMVVAHHAAELARAAGQATAVAQIEAWLDQVRDRQLNNRRSGADSGNRVAKTITCRRPQFTTILTSGFP